MGIGRRSGAALLVLVAGPGLVLVLRRSEEGGRSAGGPRPPQLPVAKGSPGELAASELRIRAAGGAEVARVRAVTGSPAIHVVPADDP